MIHNPAEKSSPQPIGPVPPPAKADECLWYVHSLLAAFLQPLALDRLAVEYERYFGHHCMLTRCLVVDKGGLAATFARIPHIATLVQCNGMECIKTTQLVDVTKVNFLEAHQRCIDDLVEQRRALRAHLALS